MTRQCERIKNKSCSVAVAQVPREWHARQAHGALIPEIERGLREVSAASGLTRLQLRIGAARLLEHRPRLLVAEGRLLEDELRRCGLTRNDLNGLPRQHGIEELRLIRHLVFELHDQVSIIRETSAAP